MNKAIVLAHGLFMKKGVMSFLKSEFLKKGYDVYNFSYNTRTFNGETIQDFKRYVDFIPNKEIYFVGHSMGGLLMRHYFSNYKPKFKDTCIVTLGTPHKGSSFGDTVGKSPLGAILGTAASSGVSKGLPPWNPDLADLGCIVGIKNIGLNIFFNSSKNEGDGTVLVKEAIAENSKAHTFVDANHTMLVYSKEVVDLTDRFIRNRNFD